MTTVIGPWSELDGLAPISGFAAEALDEALRMLTVPEVDYRADPAQWLIDKLGEFPWSKQREIMESVRDNRFTAVRSCHGAGKSYLGGRELTWWIDTAMIANDRFVISTAPSAAQVSAVLWREVARAHRKGNLPGRINTAGYPQWKIFDGPDGLVGYGRRPADYSDSAFQGIHAPEGVLIVVDEANGVPASLYQQIDSIASNEDCRVLLIGNPTDPNSYFARACAAGSKYNVIHIDALRTPNFTEELTRPFPLVRALMQAEGIPYSTEEVPEELRRALVGPMWVNECLTDWCGIPADLAEGRSWPEVQQFVLEQSQGSAVFMARVRAVFPDEEGDSVIPLGWIEQAMIRWEAWRDGVPRFDGNGEPDLSVPEHLWPVPPRKEQVGRRVVGVDVAREGADKTVYAIRQGQVVEDVIVRPKQDTMKTADEVDAYLGWPHALGVIDIIGIGAGVYDRLRQRGRTVIGFNASEQDGRTDKTGRFRFRNNRSAAWWNLRELLDPSRGHHVCLPRDEQLMVELATPKWKLMEGQPIYVVESKDEIKKRLGRSPDRADATIQVFWNSGTAPDNQFEQPSAVAYGSGNDEHVGYVAEVGGELWSDLRGWDE